MSAYAWLGILNNYECWCCYARYIQFPRFSYCILYPFHWLRHVCSKRDTSKTRIYPTTLNSITKTRLATAYISQQLLIHSKYIKTGLSMSLVFNQWPWWYEIIILAMNLTLTRLICITTSGLCFAQNLRPYQIYIMVNYTLSTLFICPQLRKPPPTMTLSHAYHINNVAAVDPDIGNSKLGIMFIDYTLLCSWLHFL